MPLNSDYLSEVFEMLRGMFTQDEHIQNGQMMGHPAFYYAPPGCKRKMFACVWGAGVALKLPQELIDGLLSEPGCEPFAPMGRPMRGWLVVHWETAAELSEAEELIRSAASYVAER
jgi:hypothetical protein